MDDLIKDYIFKAVIKAVAARAVAALPFLALPVINPIFMYLLEKIAGMFYKELTLRVEFQIIDIKTGGQVKELEESAKALLEAQKTGEGIADATKKFNDAAASLIRFNK